MGIYTPKYKCVLCDYASDCIQGLTTHIKKHNHNSKTYFDAFLKKPEDGVCRECGCLTNYINIVKGYPAYCGKCSHRILQWTGEKGQARRNLHRERFMGNTISVGRPKGSVNKKPYPMTDAVIQRMKNLPKQPWLGKKHTLSTREKMSETRVSLIKENGGNMAYKGRFIPRNPQKYIGDHKNIIWRSTWEAKYMHWLDTNESVLAWNSEEIVIPYKDPLEGHTRRYFPDFYAKMKGKDGKIKSYIIEIKPKVQTLEPVKKSKVTKKFIKEVYTYNVNQNKWKAATEYCKDKGWEFIVLTEDELGITR